MIADAHVHFGYFSRCGEPAPHYYSPRRIVGVLNRCGVGEFIVSSTCAQVKCIGIKDIVREAREMKRLAGSRAHVFFWLSGHLYDDDPEMKWIGTGLFDGIKLHERETPWVQKRRKDLEKILAVAEKHELPVMFHAGTTGWCHPSKLAKIANEHPRIRFDFAHCRPMNQMAKVVAECPNVWTDTAYITASEFQCLADYDWHGRLMFGTDLPVWQALEDISLTRRYMKYVNMLRSAELVDSANQSFFNFIQPLPRAGRACGDP